MENKKLSWDHYFMSIAVIASLRSVDPNSKVGSVIVSPENKILGVGYNGFVTGIDESKLSLSREGSWLDSKYPYIVHSEVNAIVNSVVHSLKNSKLYCTLFPCNDCTKILAQAGIKEIIYLSNKHEESDMYIASKRLLDLSNINYRQLNDFNINKEIPRGILPVG